VKIKKKNINTLLAIFSGLIIVYSVVFFKTLSNIDEEFKYTFKSEENYLFHKKYSKQTHHLRNESALDTIIVDTKARDLLFTNIYEKGEKTILFQGDSFIQQIHRIKNKKSYEMLKDFGIKKEINIIGAGIASYSPSLMNMQLDLLEKDFNIKPNIIIAFINQKDFGDELCRYKKNKVYIDGKFEKIYQENDFEGEGWFNYSNAYGLSEIKFKNTSIYFTTFEIINFKAKKKITRVIKKINYLMKQKKLPKKCYNEEMDRYLYHPSKADKKYFRKTIAEYINKVAEKKNVEKLILVTFPLKEHFLYKKNKTKNVLPYNIATLVNKTILDKKDIIHLDFSDLLLDDLSYDYTSIWTKDQIHLNPTNHSNIFIKNILKELNSLL
jgi:hypothetical protein